MSPSSRDSEVGPFWPASLSIPACDGHSRRDLEQGIVEGRVAVEVRHCLVRL